MTRQMEYKTPIIIPAFKAQERIEQTLLSLPAETVEPIIAINGPIDRTAEIAERYGATVLTFEQQGKLPSIQGALRHMGNRALSPILILDVDSRPIFPSLWRSGMVHEVMGEKDDHNPAIVGGPVIFTEDTVFENTIRTARRMKRAMQSRNDRIVGSKAAQYGPNMAINIAQDELLEKILALDNYWPGEDRALVDTVEGYGGVFTQPISPNLLVFTPSSKSYLSYFERKRTGVDEARNQVTEHYRENAPPNSRPYDHPEKQA
ncbi:MAG: glycosyltransferase [Patescibacteria group bacterium]